MLGCRGVARALPALGSQPAAPPPRSSPEKLPREAPLRAAPGPTAQRSPLLPRWCDEVGDACRGHGAERARRTIAYFTLDQDRLLLACYYYQQIVSPWF